MIEGIPRISVGVITYKQEKIVSRALDSLLAQKDYIYEICVSDDCSPDNTWQVLLDYQGRYPDFIKLRRNERNVGIFENIELRRTMLTGDIVYTLAGDDEAGKDWFKSVVEYIINNKIDYKNKRVCFYGNTKVVYPNGDEFIRNNCLIKKHPYDSLSLVMRGAVNAAGCCYSAGMIELFENVSRGRSYAVEEIQDRQLQLNTDVAYYIPTVCNVYYANIGVSVGMNASEKEGRRDIFIDAYNYFKDKQALKERDGYYYLYKDAQVRYLLDRTFNNYIDVLRYRLKSFVLKYDFNPASIKRVLFAVLRRMPHKKPLRMNL